MTKTVMSMRSLPRRVITAGAVFAVVAMAVGAGYVWSTGRQTGEVALPPHDATPEQVVHTLLAALNEHDCETAVQLTTARGVDSVTGWCRNVRSLDQIRVGRPSPEDPQWSGSPTASEVVRVPVEFDVAWRPFKADGSIPEGPMSWGYIVRRDQPGDPWRVLDQGMG